MQNIRYFTVCEQDETETIHLGGYSFRLISDGNPLESAGVKATKKVTQFFIEFDDKSTIEIMNVHTSNPYYSKVDSVPGKNRLEFINKFQPKDAIKILNRLTMSLGFTETANCGRVVLVNPKNVVRKIYL